MQQSQKSTRMISLCAGVFAVMIGMQPAEAQNLPSFKSETAPVALISVSLENKPSLIISDDEQPEVLYSKGSGESFLGRSYTESDVRLDKPYDLKRSYLKTSVSKTVGELEKDYADLRESVKNKRDTLSRLNTNTESIARDYYALIAGMNTKLQLGTTPGNPDLVESWDAAQVALNALGDTTSALSALASDVTDDATQAEFILQSTRAAYGISGARDEDHENLSVIEDRLLDTINVIDRDLTDVNDAINRRTAYLRSERSNLQTLSLAVAKGDLYGNSIKNRLFEPVLEASVGVARENTFRTPIDLISSGVAEQKTIIRPIENRKPLVQIKFDQPNLQYETALYSALDAAISRNPNMQFDLVTVSPDRGNRAEKALGATSARKNGEAVLRSLAQMGVPSERISLNSTSSRDARNSEVHIYVR